jgi:hypothetical protein
LLHTGERGSGVFEGLRGRLESFRGIFTEFDPIGDRLGEHRGGLLAGSRREGLLDLRLSLTQGSDGGRRLFKEGRGLLVGASIVSPSPLRA